MGTRRKIETAQDIWNQAIEETPIDLRSPFRQGWDRYGEVDVTPSEKPEHPEGEPVFKSWGEPLLVGTVLFLFVLIEVATVVGSLVFFKWLDG